MPCYNYPYYRLSPSNIYNPQRFPLYNAYDSTLIYPRCTYKDCACSAFKIRTYTKPLTKCESARDKPYWKSLN